MLASPDYYFLQTMVANNLFWHPLQTSCGPLVVLVHVQTSPNMIGALERLKTQNPSTDSEILRASCPERKQIPANRNRRDELAALDFLQGLTCVFLTKSKILHVFRVGWREGSVHAAFTGAIDSRCIAREFRVPSGPEFQRTWSKQSR